MTKLITIIEDTNINLVKKLVVKKHKRNVEQSTKHLRLGG